MRDCGRVDVPEVVTQRVVGDLSQRPRQFDARRATAHHHKGQPCSAGVGVELALGFLKCQQYPPAYLSGIFNGFQARCQRLPLIVAEIMMARSSRDDQRVIRRLAIAQNNPAACDVEIHNFAQQHLGVPAAPQNVPQRRCNLAGRQPARGHLIKQRLKEMKVAPIDQRQFDRHAPQRLGRVESAESASEDDYAVRHRFSPPS